MCVYKGRKGQLAMDAWTKLQVGCIEQKDTATLFTQKHCIKANEARVHTHTQYIRIITAEYHRERKRISQSYDMVKINQSEYYMCTFYITDNDIWYHYTVSHADAVA